MQPHDLDELYSRHIHSDERLGVQISWGDQVEQLSAEIRFRGNTTRREPKKGYSIRFNGGDQDYLWGGDRINARSMWRDPSFVREHMAMWMFREYNLPAPRTLFFELFINDIFEGFYVHVERIDRRFSRSRGLNRNATLVRDQFRMARHNDCGVGASKTSAFANNNWSSLSYEDALTCVSRKFDERRAEWREVLDFILWVDNSQPGDTFAEELTKRVDLDSLIKFLGIHILIGDADSLWGNDYWWFKDHEDPDAKWFFIPWDKNLSFGSHTRGYTDGLGAFGQLMLPLEYEFSDAVGENRLFLYVLQTPTLMDQLKGWLLEQIDSSTWLENFDHELQLALLQTTPYGRPRGFYDDEFVRNAENHFDLYGDYNEHVQQVTEYRDLRRNYLRQKLSSGLSGPRHQVNVTLGEDHPAGEVIWLVDGHGFTLGRFVPDEKLEAGSFIGLKAVGGSNDHPINKVWELSSDRRLKGELSVYYRNDTVRVGSAPEDHNWYTGGGHSIGMQPYIELKSNTDGLTLESVRARPMINRLDAIIEYNLSGSGGAVLSTKLNLSKE